MSFHRGRLIFPIKVTLRRLDTQATATASGYDDNAGEVTLSASADGLGTPDRVNQTDIDVPVQVEQRDLFEALDQMMQGDAPNTSTHLTFHLNDLKRLGLWVEDTDWGGRPTIKKGDQVLGFKDMNNNQLHKVPDNPGLFITEVKPTGYLGTQNLIVCVISDRGQGAREVER